MLERLRDRGLVLAGHDNRILCALGRRREVRAHPLYDHRNGTLLASRAWEITDAGTAALVGAARRRRGAGRSVDRQIDIEDAIAATSSGSRPDAAPLTDPDTPAPDRAGASAPEGRPVETCARGRTPETANA